MSIWNTKTLIFRKPFLPVYFSDFNTKHLSLKSKEHFFDFLLDDPWVPVLNRTYNIACLGIFETLNKKFEIEFDWKPICTVMLLFYSGFWRDDTPGILIQNLVHFHRFNRPLSYSICFHDHESKINDCHIINWWLRFYFGNLFNSNTSKNGDVWERPWTTFVNYSGIICCE